MKSDLFAVIEKEEHVMKADICEVQKTCEFIAVGTVDSNLVVKPGKKRVPTLEELGYSFEMGM